MLYQINSSPWVKKITPIALTIAAGAGVVGTATLAAIATPKALERKEKAEKEKGEPLTTWEKFKAMTPSYIPAIGMGVATVGSICGIVVDSNRKQAELATVIAGGNQIINRISQKYTMLHDTVKEKHPETAEEFDRKSFDDKWNEYVKRTTNHKKAWCGCPCFPDCSGEDWGVPRLFGIEYGNGLVDENGHELIFFEATPGDIMTAMYNVNALFQANGIIKVNDLFYQLNIPKTGLGELLVWDSDVLFAEWESSWIGIYTEDWQMEDDVPQPATGTIIHFHIPPLAEGYAEGMNIKGKLHHFGTSKIQSV